MIKDGGKPLNSRIYLQKLKKTVLVELWQKYFKIPTGLTNADREGRGKKHVKICDIMPTSKGEGRIRENLKCAEKQAASARAVPELTDFIHLYFRTKKGRWEGKKHWKSSLLGGLCLHATDLLLLEALCLERLAKAGEKGLTPQQYCATTVPTVWLLGDL